MTRSAKCSPCIGMPRFHEYLRSVELEGCFMFTAQALSELIFPSRETYIQYNRYTRLISSLAVERLHHHNASHARNKCISPAQIAATIDGRFLDGNSSFVVADYNVFEKSLPLPLSSRPMIRPNRPSTEEKISITRILTKLRCLVSQCVRRAKASSANLLHSQTRIGCIRQRSTAPVDTNTDTANQIAHSHQYP